MEDGRSELNMTVPVLGALCYGFGCWVHVLVLIRIGSSEGMKDKSRLVGVGAYYACGGWRSDCLRDLGSWCQRLGLVVRCLSPLRRVGVFDPQLGQRAFEDVGRLRWEAGECNLWLGFRIFGVLGIVPCRHGSDHPLSVICLGTSVLSRLRIKLWSAAGELRRLDDGMSRHRLPRLLDVRHESGPRLVAAREASIGLTKLQ